MDPDLQARPPAPSSDRQEPHRRRQLATVVDVARLAGVSTATVDRVLNQRPGVRPVTVERVLKAAAEIGYVLDAALPVLDAPLRARYAAAYKSGQVLRFIARLHADGRATVGLEALDADDPLAGGSGTDNRVAIWCDRYPHQPLVVQGPGAGAEVTAAALLDDALAIQAACAYDFTPKNSAIGSGRWNANPWA